MTTRTRAVLLICLLAVLGCERPGEGLKAERGYARCAPLIDALERYRVRNDGYPERLEDLVPEFIEATALAVPDEAAYPHEAYPLDYRRRDGGYALEFTYTGPGMNHCTYDSDTGWDCTGYY